jgi:EAL domain-containing protein (putative c-di-GMP-specific phosphodiesterase class I)/AmiR/NasT family two-component response regulator
MDHFKSLRILLVDDDDFLLGLMSASLKSFGLQSVEIASNGAQVLSMLEAGGRYDVILSDLNMPEMDGIELMRHLAERRYPGGVILLTGEHPKILQTAYSLAKAHNLNLLGVLQKPFERDDLLALLNHFAETASVGEPINLGPEVSVQELREAIATGQIIPHFHPRVEIATHRVVGVETLARWQHPDKGLIMPGTFIPLAERHGLILELSESMLLSAIEQGASWLADGLELKLAINMTAEDMEDVSIPDRLAGIAQTHEMPLSNLVLELTESQLMEKLSLTLDTLIRLRLKGVTLAVDDFGTGYSNLGQIKRAPFSELKIDRSFVSEGVRDEEGRAILEASILMGRKLGLTVVAEGVETDEEWALVKALGAHEVQGYLIARPMPAEQIPAWIDSWHTGTAKPAD